MTLDATKVRRAVTGAVSKGLISATAPTGTAGTLTGFTDLGYISEDGVTTTLPEGGDVTRIPAWQNGDTVITIRSASEDLPTISFVMLETKKEVVETYFGVTVDQTATEGSFEYDSNVQRSYDSYVVDVIDGAELIRRYVPRGYVQSVGDQVFANGEPIGYEVTIECERDSTKGFNFKEWSTALKTPA